LNYARNFNNLIGLQEKILLAFSTTIEAVL